MLVVLSCQLQSCSAQHCLQHAVWQQAVLKWGSVSRHALYIEVQQYQLVIWMKYLRGCVKFT